jgi:hypothetical protein
METIEENKINDSPYEERECLCGCGKTFIPKRSDQYHLNKLHTNRAYNEGTRKNNLENERDIIKILRRNDRILKKYFNTDIADEVEHLYNMLQADGFMSGFYIGTTVFKEVTYYMSFNYQYMFSKKEGFTIIKIKLR